MKNLKKGVTLFAMTMLLAACGGTKKQPAVEPKKAEEIAFGIYESMAKDPLPFSTPDECSVDYEMKYTEYNKTESESYESVGGMRISVRYSKAKNMYYQEQAEFYSENGEDEEVKQCQWITLDGEILHCYILVTDGKDDLYSYDATDGIGLEDYAASQFEMYNAMFVQESLESCSYSDEAPDLDGAPVGAVATYSTYYGSSNEGSIQVEEKCKIEADFKDEDENELHGTDVENIDVLVEDYILQNYKSVSGYDFKTLDGKMSYGEGEEITYKFSKKYASAPKLDKDLWKDVIPQ